MSSEKTDRTEAPMQAGPAAPRLANRSPAALRALAEAAERRRVYDEKAAAMPPEIGGPKGPEPGRYGDWEIKGLASDF